MHSETQTCKICNSNELRLFAHTATCMNCGVLLCYPYPKSDDEIYVGGVGREKKSIEQIKDQTLKWHLRSGKLRHQGFTNMALFALDEKDRSQNLRILDYGGGGGQFALVLKSLFPLSDVYIVDICDYRLLEQFAPLSQQIKYVDFVSDTRRFDVIFMNDVFEHVSNPLGVLKTLRSKMANHNSRIFIDTPCQCWIYPMTKFFNKKLHAKVLRGTVDYDHQQIWSKSSFLYVAKEADLYIEKYLETSEFTQQPEFYLDNMNITNSIIRLIGRIFYCLAPHIAKNKIMAVLRPSSALFESTKSEIGDMGDCSGRLRPRERSGLCQYI